MTGRLLTGRLLTDRRLTDRRLTGIAVRATRPLHTVRLRLTLWYGGLFLVSGAGLLAVTYGLVVQAFIGKTAGSALCAGPAAAPARCHVIGAQQAQAIALAEHAAVLHELLTRSELALAGMAVLSVALGWFIAGRALRPLRVITAAAREISAASLGERLALPAPRDEVRELADTFNGLLARLEASFDSQRQFVANASHELRTPLARQRVISQVALADPGATVESLRAAHERVLASGAQQEQLIEALLALARGQAGLSRHEPFDLAAVTRQVVAAREAEADHRNLTLSADLRAAPATGNSRLTERLAANLVDNALRHNEPGGQVAVSTKSGPARPSCQWPTPDHLSRRMPSAGCSSLSSGSALTAPVAAKGPASACPSRRPSPMPMAPASLLPLSHPAGCSSR